jgi:hypothetical protein
MNKLYTSPLAWFLMAAGLVASFIVTDNPVWLGFALFACYRLGIMEERGSAQCVDCGIDQVVREGDEAADEIDKDNPYRLTA